MYSLKLIIIISKNNNTVFITFEIVVSNLKTFNNCKILTFIDLI